MPSTTSIKPAADNAPPKVTFDPLLIQKTGGIGEVLVALMTDQKRKIQQELQQEFKKEKVTIKTLRRILNSFVSLEGTKQPRRIEELQFPEISEKVVLATVNKLVDARLLRESEDGVYELVHDTLAEHLDQTRDQEDIAVDETVKMVKDAFYFQEKTRRFLSEEELNKFEKYKEVIQSSHRLTEEEWAFVEKSRKKEKRRQRNIRFVFFAALVAAVVMTSLWIQTKNVIKERDQTIQENDRLLTELGLNSDMLKETARAIRESNNDRTAAFRILHGLQNDTSNFANDNPMIGELTNNFLAEFSLFPFYHRDEILSETIDEIIVDDSLKFILGAAKDSPVPFFKNFSYPEDRLKSSIRNKSVLIDPGDFMKYGKIRDMLALKDERTIFTGHEDGKIWKWDIEKDDPPSLVYEFERGLIREMVLAGNHLLVGLDSIVYEINLRRAKPFARFLIGFNRPIQQLVSNPVYPGQYAVVKENSGKIFLCNLDSAGIQKTYEAALSTVTSLAFSPDGKKMIAAYEEGELAKLWDLNRPEIITDFKGHRALISSIAFSPDGRKILTGSWDQTAILWTYKGEIIKRLVGHDQRIHSVAYTLNHYAVTSDDDGEIKTWDLTPMAEKELIFKDSIRALAVTNRHDTVAFSLYGDKGFFLLWHWPTNSLDTVWQPLKSFDKKGDIVALAYAGDGKGIVAASENTLTTFIDRSGRNRHEDYRGGGRAKIPYTPTISAVDINQDYVLIADRKTNSVLLRDRKNPDKFKALEHPNQVQAARFSPDNRYILSGCDDENAYLWEVASGAVVRTLKGHTAKVVAVDFSPDGQYVLTGSYDNTANLYKLDANETGDLPPDHKLDGVSPSYQGHTSDVNAVAFSHEIINGNYRFTTAGADKAGKYWELNSSDELRELPCLIRHLDEVTVAGFLPGDSLIVTGSFDETLKVWRADQVGQLIDRRVFGQ